MTEFKILKQAMAGTLESSDIHITIDENADGIDIDLTSSVENQYGKQIRKVLVDTLNELGIKNARLTVVDKGALDCTIKARTIAAVCRASGVKEGYDWEEIDSWNV